MSEKLTDEELMARVAEQAAIGAAERVVELGRQLDAEHTRREEAERLIHALKLSCEGAFDSGKRAPDGVRAMYRRIIEWEREYASPSTGEGEEKR